MNIHSVRQGTPEWLAHRRLFRNASDAAAMLGCSPHKTRSALVREIATGIAEERSQFVQDRLFGEGHRTEALARERAQEIVGEDLYPVVASHGELSASMDGITMSEEVVWEHKLLNEDLRKALLAGPVGDANALPLHYRVQMEQQLMVASASRVLFHATKWNGDVLAEECYCWYKPDPELRERISRGWVQFAEDVKAYVPEQPVAPPPVAAAIEALPALLVTVEGRVVTSNLAAFREAADAFIGGIKTDLQTDQDFADAERTVTFCKTGEERLEMVKSQALAQTASIDELFRTIDHISEELRQKRLSLDRLVKARKESIRAEIAAEAFKAICAHVIALNTRLGAAWVQPPSPHVFGDAMKGKKTVASVREACNVALANAKIDTSAVADRLDANRKSLVIDGRDWFFLFADFGHVGNAPAETFSAVAAQRINQQKAREAEETRRQHEAQAAAQAAAALVSAAPVPVAPSPAPTVVPTLPTRRASDPTALISTGLVCERLGFTVTSQFLQRLGAVPIQAEKKAGFWWSEADFGLICDALVRHIQSVKHPAKAAA